MESSSDRLKPGDAVRIRHERWRVTRWIPFGDTAAIDVAGADLLNRGATARFLLPFESVERLAASNAPRVVRPSRWRPLARRALGRATPTCHSLRAAAAAAIDLVPFQLEPALAVVSGRGCRVLIADEVGLGKTIQAALIVAELFAREPEARALVVCPAGLREQWRDELDGRFALRPVVLDAARLARATRERAAAINPWMTARLAITSIDYLKRAEVIRALEPIVWDAVLLDEAHGLVGASDRAAAAGALAARARRVVLLTATPHSGDDDAFRRLCRLGHLPGDAPLLLFRRMRADVGGGGIRRTRTLRVMPTSAERAMHDALRAYARRVWRSTAGVGARLVVTVLMRRACSSATSLARSVGRRLTLLGGSASADAQPSLPFAEPADSDDEPGWLLAARGLEDSAHEQRLLEELLALARRAADDESKIAALARLLRRVGEPALVFTEYRDTLSHVAQQLSNVPSVHVHGGTTLTERLAAARAFTNGDANLLLATDAASEGLNLHRRCRLVITLELPWSPVRLEQRIGRVDRIGQRRSVHAVHLVAAGTGEEAVTARLAGRSAHALHALHAAATADQSGDVTAVDLRVEAESEAARLATARQLAEGADRNLAGRPALCLVRPRHPIKARADARSTPRAFWLWNVRVTDAIGRPMWDCPVALGSPLSGLPSGRGEVRLLLAGARPATTLALAAGRLDALLQPMDAVIALLDRREKAILAALHHQQARLAASLIQPGLFDRRHERAAQAQAATAREAIARSEARLLELDAWRCPRIDAPTLVFAVALG